MKYQGLCTFPHGQLSIYVFIMSISSLLFVLSSSWGCYYVYVDATFSSKSNSDGKIFADYSAGFGLFSYEDGADQNDSHFNFICYPYAQNQLNQLDSMFYSARALAVLANILVGVAMLLSILTCCVQFGSFSLMIIASFMIGGGVFEILTFLVFGSNLCKDHRCTFYIGAGCALAGFLVSVITGIIACYMPESVEPFKSEELGEPLEPFQPGTITETETVLPDGTTKITRTTVNLDGSKTIEEDVYDPPEQEPDVDVAPVPMDRGFAGGEDPNYSQISAADHAEAGYSGNGNNNNAQAINAQQGYQDSGSLSSTNVERPPTSSYVPAYQGIDVSSDEGGYHDDQESFSQNYQGIAAKKPV